MDKNKNTLECLRISKRSGGKRSYDQSKNTTMTFKRVKSAFLIETEDHIYRLDFLSIIVILMKLLR